MTNPTQPDLFIAQPLFPVTLAQAESAPVEDIVGAPTAAPAGGEGITGENGGNTAPGQNAAATGSPFQLLLPFLLLLMVFMIFQSFMSSRKQKKKRMEMLATLGKGAQIQTIGGILGRVVEVRDGEVVVEVDPSIKSRMRFTTQAIQTVISSGGGAADEPDLMQQPPAS